jgi:hypothetical protein
MKDYILACIAFRTRYQFSLGTLFKEEIDVGGCLAG